MKEKHLTLFISRILKQGEDKEIRKTKKYRNRKRIENQNKHIDEMFHAMLKLFFVGKKNKICNSF